MISTATTTLRFIAEYARKFRRTPYPGLSWLGHSLIHRIGCPMTRAPMSIVNVTQG